MKENDIFLYCLRRDAVVLMDMFISVLSDIEKLTDTDIDEADFKVLDNLYRTLRTELHEQHRSFFQQSESNFSGLAEREGQ